MPNSSSFWGLNPAGREAQAFPRELGAYSAEQMRQWLDQARTSGDISDYYTQGLADYWGARINDGWKSPEEIRSAGQQISPWVTDYANNRVARGQSVADREAGRRSTADVTGEMSGRLDEQGQNIGRNFDDISSIVNQTTQRGMERDDSTSMDVVNNIKGSSASRRGGFQDTYGGLRTDNAGTYDNINEFGDTAFSDMDQTLSVIEPGGQAQAARVGRSFAPQVSDTLMRLRRSGIDPNSPEAASLLRGVETDRARAMDDASADATLSYVDRKNRNTGEQLGFKTDAARQRLAGEVDLATAQAAKIDAISGKEADDYNAERLRNSQSINSMDFERGGQIANSTNAAYQDSQRLLTDRNGLTSTRRDMEMQDTDRYARVQAGLNDDELAAGEAIDQQFDRGSAWQGMDRTSRDQAASNIWSIANRYNSNQFASDAAAGKWGNTANNAYQTALSYEAPQAGWGARMLGGLAVAGISAYNPAAGQFAGQMLGGVPTGTQQQSGGGQGGQFGSGWGGGQNPYSFSYGQQGNYQMPSTRLSRPSSGYSYDPAKTQTRPNGDLQVGRYNN